MADQSIKINIGTTYSGAGMQKAMSATKQLGDVSKRAAGAIGQLGSAFGGMDGQIGKAVSSIAGFASAIAVAGPVGLAITAITSLVSMFKELSDEAEKTRKAQMKAFSDNLMKGIDNYGKSIDTVIDKLGKLQAQQEKVAKSTVDLNNAMTDKNVAQRQLEAINEAANASSGERGVIQARANIDIARMKGESAVSSADANVNAAQGKLNTTTTALGQVGDEIRALTLRLETLNGLNRAYHDTAHREGYQNQTTIDKSHQAQLAVNKAQKKLAELQERQANLIQTQEAQRNELAAAEQKAQTARINADAENAKAQTALKDAEDKAWEEEQKARDEAVKEMWAEVAVRAEREAKMKEEARAEQKLKDTIKQHDEDEKALDEATKELEMAQRNYAYRVHNAMIANANTHWATALGGPGGAWNGGSAIPAGQIVNNGINGQNRYTPRNNASIHDTGYNERVAAGMERNAQSQGYGLSARDRHRQQELYDKAKRGTPLSNKELDELKDLNERDPAKQKEKADKELEKARKEAEEKQKQKDEAEQKLKDDVSEIVTLMRQLGLK